MKFNTGAGSRGVHWGWHWMGVGIVAWWLSMMGLMFGSGPAQGGLSLSSRKMSADIVEGEEWMGAYYQGRKIGHVHSKIQEEGEGIVLKQRSKWSIRFGGIRQGLDSRMEVRLQKDWTLQRFDFQMSSDWLTTRIEGQWEDGGLALAVELGDQKFRQLLPVKEPPLFDLTLPRLLADQDLQPGMRYQVLVFDPQSMSNRPSVVEVVGLEAISSQGLLVPAIHLKRLAEETEVNTWISERGVVLQEEYPFGLMLRKETEDQAATPDEGAADLPGDFSMEKMLRPFKHP